MGLNPWCDRRVGGPGGAPATFLWSFMMFPTRLIRYHSARHAVSPCLRNASVRRCVLICANEPSISGLLCLYNVLLSSIASLSVMVRHAIVSGESNIPVLIHRRYNPQVRLYDRPRIPAAWVRVMSPVSIRERVLIRSRSRTALA